MKMSQLIVWSVIPNNFQSILDHKFEAKLFSFFFFGGGRGVQKDTQFPLPQNMWVQHSYRQCTFTHMLHAFNPPTVNSFLLSGDIHRCGNVLTINFSSGIVNRSSHQEVPAAQQGT